MPKLDNQAHPDDQLLDMTVAKVLKELNDSEGVKNFSDELHKVLLEGIESISSFLSAIEPFPEDESWDDEEQYDA